jgi:predicted phage-related endonuclease
VEPSIEMQILQRLTAVETKLDMQLNAKDIAVDALDKAKSAHLRLSEQKVKIDEMDKHFDNEVKSMNIRIDNEIRAVYTKIEADTKEIARVRLEDIKEHKADRKWLIGTLITVGALTIAVITLGMKVLGI